jgi:hypothetical protein
LTSVSISNTDSLTWTADYGYHKNGDMTGRTIQSNSTGFTYNGNEMASAAGSKSFALGYDLNDNLTADRKDVSTASTLAYIGQSSKVGTVHLITYHIGESTCILYLYLCSTLELERFNFFCSLLATPNSQSCVWLLRKCGTLPASPSLSCEFSLRHKQSIKN